MTEERNRINTFHGWALIISAAAIDTIQFILTFIIPIIGLIFADIISIVARIVFWVWFQILHVGFADKSSRLVINISMTVLEFIPGVDALPAWTVGTWAIIHQVRKEDKEYNEKLKRSKKKTIKAANDNFRQQRYKKAA